MQRKATLCIKPLSLDWSGRQHHLSRIYQITNRLSIFARNLSDFFEEVICFTHKFWPTYGTVHGDISVYIKSSIPSMITKSM